MQLAKGQKIPLNENSLIFKFEHPNSALEIDTAAFLTQSNGKVAGDDDFVFYGNTNHISGGVIHKNDAIEINLDKIPRHVEKISLTATIYDADKRNQNFSMIRGAVLKILSLYGDSKISPSKPLLFSAKSIAIREIGNLTPPAQVLAAVLPLFVIISVSKSMTFHKIRLRPLNLKKLVLDAKKSLFRRLQLNRNLKKSNSVRVRRLISLKKAPNSAKSS